MSVKFHIQSNEDAALAEANGGDVRVIRSAHPLVENGDGIVSCFGEE